ncbi:hemolytic lectin [Phlebopus sp. FC_14]|nr:hemolytic lectin [Phlebopus sp. FC_14]
MSDFYIPPEGIYFRLLGYVSQKVLFARYVDPPFGQVPQEPVYEDQYFTLIHGTGAHEGTYVIKSLKTGYVLFSRRTSQPYVGVVSGDGQYSDNWFEIKPGTGQYVQQFQLITPSNNLVLYSRTNAAPYIGNVYTYDFYPDQYFSFVWEDMQVDKVEYDLKLGQIVSSTPLIIANQTLTNNSSHEQEMTFVLNETVTHTSTFEYSLGLTITVGTTFKAGVPIVAEAEFSLDFSVSNQFTWGQTTEFSESYTAKFPVKAGPGKTVRAVSTVNKGELKVPYTIILSSKRTGVKTETKGIWHGVSSWDLRHTISED